MIHNWVKLVHHEVVQIYYAVCFANKQDSTGELVFLTLKVLVATIDALGHF